MAFYFLFLFFIIVTITLLGEIQRKVLMAKLGIFNVWKVGGRVFEFAETEASVLDGIVSFVIVDYRCYNPFMGLW
ncbi:hypothetical protein GGU11DRAFT_804415 [Lentinula aff. detonsa]|nr:hypothetical protein GGU11DRAFT_804415 [Lentinula aff. detonsa]